MNLKNALKLTFLNNNMVLKSLIYRLFVLAIYATLSYLLLKDLLFSISKISISKEYIIFVLNSTKDYFFAYKGKFILFVLLSFCCGLLNNFADSSIVDIVNKHMSILSREGFFGSFVRNFFLSLSYGLIYTLFSLVFIFFAVFLAFILIINLLNVVGWSIIALSIILFVLIISLKQTIISLVLPYSVCNGCNVFVSILKNDFKKSFLSLYSNYILAYSLAIYVNLSAAFVTFGAALILSAPLSFILIDILGLTSFYEVNKMKYYITYDMKCIPKELRDNDESLLNEMNI